MQKIMIIEDEAALAQELALLLTQAGYQAYVVQDFAHPLLEIESQLPDLLLLDIQLPGVNGHQLLQEIRKKYQFPIIMVTSRANEMDEVLAMSYGADNYITKPYNPTALLLHIAAMFKRMQPQSTSLIQYQRKKDWLISHPNFYWYLVLNCPSCFLPFNVKIVGFDDQNFFQYVFLPY